MRQSLIFTLFSLLIFNCSIHKDPKELIKEAVCSNLAARLIIPSAKTCEIKIISLEGIGCKRLDSLRFLNLINKSNHFKELAELNQNIVDLGIEQIKLGSYSNNLAQYKEELRKNISEARSWMDSAKYLLSCSKEVEKKLETYNYTNDCYLSEIEFFSSSNSIPIRLKILLDQSLNVFVYEE